MSENSDDKVTIVEATGHAASGVGGRTIAKQLEEAMSQAVLDCYAADPPITDPAEQRAAMMKARADKLAEIKSAAAAPPADDAAE